jgi:REP element-mobilizing transposase RayT
LFHAFDRNEPVDHLSGNLPHWRQRGATYFITFRTADSLPKERLNEWVAERAVSLRNNPEPHSKAQQQEYWERFPARFHYWLDQGYGELRKIVENGLRYFDVDRYKLDEFVVMPNLVHALLAPLGEHLLSSIVHSWKSFTANRINKVLGRTRAFWQKESFDHVVRSTGEVPAVYWQQSARRGCKKVDAASSRVLYWISGWKPL